MYEETEKNKALDDKGIMNNLIYAILMQSLKDLKIKNPKEGRNKLDSIIFLNSEYCELMCYVSRKDYHTLKRCANKAHRGQQENGFDLGNIIIGIR